MVLPMKRLLQTSLCSTLALSFGLGQAACDKGDTGSVSVRVWGEGYLEDGVPEDDVEDGWEVDFKRFDTEIKDMEIAGEAVKLDKPEIDATKKSKSDEEGERGQEIGSVDVKPGTHKNAAFTLVKTVVEGVAKKGDKEVSFKWEFDTPVRYSKCEAKTRVKSGGSAQFEITLHADHYLYDTLTGDEEPKLFFGPIADADADDDGKITQEELEEAPIADDFDTGSQKIKNMWDWLVAQNLTIAHTDGENHCKGEVLDEDDDEGTADDDEGTEGDDEGTEGDDDNKDDEDDE